MVEQGSARSFSRSDAFKGIGAGDGTDVLRENVGVVKKLLEPLYAVKNLDQTSLMIVE